MKTKQMEIRGFHLLSDAAGGCKPIDAICQFMFHGRQISLSTAGLSQGACQSEVVVFAKNPTTGEYDITKGLFSTVQQAIDFVNLEAALGEVSEDVLRQIKKLI